MIGPGNATDPVQVALSLPGAVVLTGPSARARGASLGGLAQVETGGGILIGDLRVAGLRAHSGTVRPSLLTRALGPEPEVEESVLLPPDAPGVVIEWSATLPATPLTISWRVPGAVRWKLSERCLVVRCAGSLVARFSLSDECAWDLTSEKGGLQPPGALLVVVRASWSDQGRIRLVAVGTPPGRTARIRAYRPLRHLEAQRVRAVASSENRGAEELEVSTEDSVLPRGLAWSAARLPGLDGGSPRAPGVPGLPRASAAPVAPGGPTLPRSRVQQVLQGLGALALGRFEQAEADLSRTGPLGAGLLGRWRGDLASRQTDSVPLRLVDILRAASAPSLSQLRRSSDPPPNGLPEAWTEAWRAFDEGRTDHAHTALRALVESGFSRAPGAWTVDEEWPDWTLTALVPATIVFGMLGAQADAFYGRLRLAPQLERLTRTLTVTNLRCGPCVVSLRYDRDGATHTFRLLQTAGAVPLNVIFEPTVPEPVIARVEVDGQEAELDRFSQGPRSGARVHLPLDQERSIVLVGSP